MEWITSWLKHSTQIITVSSAKTGLNGSKPRTRALKLYLDPAQSRNHIPAFCLSRSVNTMRKSHTFAALIRLSTTTHNRSTQYHQITRKKSACWQINASRLDTRLIQVPGRNWIWIILVPYLESTNSSLLRKCALWNFECLPFTSIAELFYNYWKTLFVGL